MCKKYENEQQVIEGLRKRESEAIKYLYETPYKKAFGVLRKQGAQHEYIHDFVFEAMLAFIKMVDREGFVLTAKISSLLTTIARNIYFKWLRGKNNLESLDEAKLNTIPEDPVDHHLIEAEEQYAQDLLMRLPILLREILRMKYMEGIDWEDIMKKVLAVKTNNIIPISYFENNNTVIKNLLKARKEIQLLKRKGSAKEITAIVKKKSGSIRDWAHRKLGDFREELIQWKSKQ